MLPCPDLTAPEHCRDPYPLYAELRKSRPVGLVEPGGFIAVSRYKDVEFVLKRPDLFSSHGFRVVLQPAWVGHNPLAQSIVASDGAEHDRMRAIVQRAFSPAAIGRLGEKVRSYAAALADRLREQGEADFMEGFATPLPARVISDILGLDHALERDYKRWTAEIVGVTPVPQDEAHIARTRATIAEMKGYMLQVIEDRRRRPSDDVIGLIVQAQIDGRPLEDHEILALAFVLLSGGLETTSFFFANAVRLLAARPDVLAALREDRKLMPRFIEEMLRYDGPVRGLPRIAMQDIELSGMRVERGACVLPLIASANRDEAQFTAPDQFNLHRERGGISFGYGSHYCIGAFLAKLEAQAGLDVLLDRFSGFTIAEELEWNSGLITSGPVRMPVRFQPS